MPAPLPEWRRAQIMDALAAGRTEREIAAWLRVSRQTVWRYARAAVQQGRAVPEPQPMGGFRWSKITREDVTAVSGWALEQPKRTLVQLGELMREHERPEVSVSTVARALHKTGLKKRRARFVDERTHSRPLIAAERRAFREAQRHDPAFGAERLLFFDETLFYLNEQAHMAWGPDGAKAAAPVLFRPKGRTASTGLLLTIGVAGDGSLVLHHELQPPARPFVALAPAFQASELEEPGRGIALALDADNASVANLRDVLRQYSVKHTDLTTRAPLVARVKQLEATGLLGLPRAGRVDVGGPRQPVRNTVKDVATHFERSFVPWYTERFDDLGQRTLVWDNASTHSAVQVNNDRQISIFHRLFREWGLRGCFFLPPRSPSFQPVEAAFAFLKHWVRQGAPDDGYTQAGLEAAIRAALARVTATMVRNWIRGCGYQVGGVAGAVVEEKDDVDSAVDEGDDDAKIEEPRGRRKRPPLSPRFADAHGSLHPAGSVPGLVDVRARPEPPRADPAAAAAAAVEPRRWPGFPGGPPVGVTETKPTTYLEALVDQRDVFEPERIVGERRAADGTVQYRIRWVGYPPSQDTWEPLEHLQAGRRGLLRDWEKRRPKS
jgi:transposase